MTEHWTIPWNKEEFRETWNYLTSKWNTLTVQAFVGICALAGLLLAFIIFIERLWHRKRAKMRVLKEQGEMKHITDLVVDESKQPLLSCQSPEGDTCVDVSHQVLLQQEKSERQQAVDDEGIVDDEGTPDDDEDSSGEGSARDRSVIEEPIFAHRSSRGGDGFNLSTVPRIRVTEVAGARYSDGDDEGVIVRGAERRKEIPFTRGLACDDVWTAIEILKTKYKLNDVTRNRSLRTYTNWGDRRNAASLPSNYYATAPAHYRVKDNCVPLVELRERIETREKEIDDLVEQIFTVEDERKRLAERHYRPPQVAPPPPLARHQSDRSATAPADLQPIREEPSREQQEEAASARDDRQTRQAKAPPPQHVNYGKPPWRYFDTLPLYTDEHVKKNPVPVKDPVPVEPVPKKKKRKNVFVRMAHALRKRFNNQSKSKGEESNQATTYSTTSQPMTSKDSAQVNHSQTRPSSSKWYKKKSKN